MKAMMLFLTWLLSLATLTTQLYWLEARSRTSSSQKQPRLDSSCNKCRHFWSMLASDGRRSTHGLPLAQWTEWSTRQWLLPSTTLTPSCNAMHRKYFTCETCVMWSLFHCEALLLFSLILVSVSSRGFGSLSAFAQGLAHWVRERGKGNLVANKETSGNKTQIWPFVITFMCASAISCSGVLTAQLG